MTALAALQSLIAQETKTLELRRSTAELKGADETLCAFLNGDGGKALIGNEPDLSSTLRRLPPPPPQPQLNALEGVCSYFAITAVDA